MESPGASSEAASAPLFRSIGSALPSPRPHSVPLADVPLVHERPAERVYPEAKRSEVLSRAVNVVIAGVALVILSPVLVLVGIAVRISSPGPIIYRQIRVGVDRRRNRLPAVYDRRGTDIGGRAFTMYKFRSMTTDAERNGVTWAKQNDARVTAIGRFLRLSRLDELPQLFNVLIGDMNIVGPRPERPSIFVRLRDQIDDYALRQRAKPGITGWAQINQDYDSTIADVRRKVQYDLAYIGRQSLMEDLRIMAQTLPVMLLRRGAR